MLYRGTCRILGVGILHYQQVLFQKVCFDGSDVTGKGNDSILQKQNCVVEEMKEVELGSRREIFILNRNYNSVGSNKISHFSRRGRAPSRLSKKKLKSLLQKTRKVRVFV